jgi:hypothetical protein
VISVKDMYSGKSRTNTQFVCTAVNIIII